MLSEDELKTINKNNYAFAAQGNMFNQIQGQFTVASQSDTSSTIHENNTQNSSPALDMLNN